MCFFGSLFCCPNRAKAASEVESACLEVDSRLTRKTWVHSIGVCVSPNRIAHYIYQEPKKHININFLKKNWKFLNFHEICKSLIFLKKFKKINFQKVYVYVLFWVPNIVIDLYISTCDGDNDHDSNHDGQ